MASLIEAIHIKRKSVFELDDVPYTCIESDITTPTARGGQTLVRLKMRNLLTSAVFEKTFKAQDKFKEPDLVLVPASYLYTDGEGSHFLDQETYETLTLTDEMMGDALKLLIEGTILQLHKFNGNPIGLQLPIFVELDVAYTEPAAQRRFLKRQRHKAGPARDGAGDPRTALYQGRRKGQGRYRDTRLRRPSLSCGKKEKPPGSSGRGAFWFAY